MKRGLEIQYQERLNYIRENKPTEYAVLAEYESNMSVDRQYIRDVVNGRKRDIAVLELINIVITKVHNGLKNKEKKD